MVRARNPTHLDVSLSHRFNTKTHNGTCTRFRNVHSWTCWPWGLCLCFLFGCRKEKGKEASDRLPVGYVSSPQLVEQALIRVEISRDWKGGKTTETHDIRDPSDPSKILCFDPSTGASLGTATAVSGDSMKTIVAEARAAQVTYAKTSFEQRRALLRTILDWVVENQASIGAMSSRDSGKTSNLCPMPRVCLVLIYSLKSHRWKLWRNPDNLRETPLDNCQWRTESGSRLSLHWNDHGS